ncbi:unnamed protein product [Zymoseptoria tritici ST99CH_3D7]|uniref:Uncharacterized protein n=1 Tax=Zymoseptoria tritici (strain ST99CH_3D7) TaxID=1276538 RepID=A0A1X7S8G5_ZYMT9|nr:unnamed protein product [Zymoseptoria tritici ST99CH_3D7]
MAEKDPITDITSNREARGRDRVIPSESKLTPDPPARTDPSHDIVQDTNLDQTKSSARDYSNVPGPEPVLPELSKLQQLVRSLADGVPLTSEQAHVLWRYRGQHKSKSNSTALIENERMGGSPNAEASEPNLDIPPSPAGGSSLASNVTAGVGGAATTVQSSAPIIAATVTASAAIAFFLAKLALYDLPSKKIAQEEADAATKAAAAATREAATKAVELRHKLGEDVAQLAMELRQSEPEAKKVEEEQQKQSRKLNKRELQLNERQRRLDEHMRLSAQRRETLGRHEQGLEDARSSWYRERVAAAEAQRIADETVTRRLDDFTTEQRSRHESLLAKFGPDHPYVLEIESTLTLIGPCSRLFWPSSEGRKQTYAPT